MMPCTLALTVKKYMIRKQKYIRFHIYFSCVDIIVKITVSDVR